MPRAKPPPSATPMPGCSADSGAGGRPENSRPNACTERMSLLNLITGPHFPRGGAYCPPLISKLDASHLLHVLSTGEKMPVTPEILLSGYRARSDYLQWS